MTFIEAGATAMAADLYGISLSDAFVAAGGPAARTPFRLAVLRQGTVELLEPFLRIGLRAIGRELDPRYGGFDAIVQDLMGEALWHDKLDATLLCLDPRRTAPEIGFASVAPEAIGLVADRIVEWAELAAERAQAPTLVLGLEDPLAPPIATSEVRSGAVGRALALRSVERAVDERLVATGAGYVLSLTEAAARIGRERMFDRQKYATHGIAFTPSGAREAAIEIAKYARGLCAGIKKVIALDCDDTLWRGLAGEEGPDAVGLTPAAWPDAGHLRFQAYVKHLVSSGVLAVLVSKNEEDSVWRVFDERAEMILKREDIAGARINWKPKSENIRSLAAELNLDPASFVFVDDRAAELEQVAQAIPEVQRIQVTKEALPDLPERIEAAGWFASARITATDRNRTEQYAAERQRNANKERTLDLTSYLRSLEMKAYLRVDLAADLERAAQMCARTNQFNLTTARHDVAAVRAFAENPGATLVTLGLRDKFGDLGDIALAIAEQEDDAWCIDSFLMSCRAFDRRCEDLLLAYLEAEGCRRGATRVEGIYKPTPRNGLVRDFYSGHGYQTKELEGGAIRAVKSCAEPILAVPDVFMLIEPGEWMNGE